MCRGSNSPVCRTVNFAKLPELDAVTNSFAEDTLEEETLEARIVVQGTFIHIEEGLQRNQKRRKTDSLLQMKDSRKTYEPGQFSKAMIVAEASEEATDPEQRTTVMMRHLPNNLTRNMLLEILDENGFSGRYDFLYLPFDFGRKSNLGYAFVNFVSERAARSFWRAFDGFSAWPGSRNSRKVCEMSWSEPHQGLEEHLERYRNSPVMHKSIPDEYKPVLFKDGRRQAFPQPTKRIKAPTKAPKKA